MNVIATLLIQALFTPVIKARAAFKSTDFDMYLGIIPEGNKNLVGWSPAEGFMQDVMRTFKTALRGAIGIWFYADNLYLAEKDENGIVSWISLDGEKMECSHDIHDSAFYQREILNEYEEVSDSVRKVFTQIFDSQCTQAPVLLGKTVIR